MDIFPLGVFCSDDAHFPLLKPEISQQEFILLPADSVFLSFPCSYFQSVSARCKKTPPQRGGLGTRIRSPSKDPVFPNPVKSVAFLLPIVNHDDQTLAFGRQPVSLLAVTYDEASVSSDFRRFWLPFPPSTATAPASIQAASQYILSLLLSDVWLRIYLTPSSGVSSTDAFLCALLFPLSFSRFPSVLHPPCSPPPFVAYIPMRFPFSLPCLPLFLSRSVLSPFLLCAVPFSHFDPEISALRVMVALVPEQTDKSLPLFSKLILLSLSPSDFEYRFNFVLRIF